MKLAKDGIDIGVRTNNLDEMLEFWTNTVGLPYDELLKAGGGIHQHRLRLKGSIFKLNHTRDPIPNNAPSSYHRLYIASDINEESNLVDPDGSLVTLIPKGTADITHIGISMKVPSLPETRKFFRDTLQAEELDDDRFRIGTTVFLLEQAAADTPAPGGPIGTGYRYLTVQVYKVDAEHKGLLERGAQEGAAPKTLGDTARISFITDADGNGIEISQRASLTGSLSAD